MRMLRPGKVSLQRRLRFAGLGKLSCQSLFFDLEAVNSGLQRHALSRCLNPLGTQALGAIRLDISHQHHARDALSLEARVDSLQVEKKALTRQLAEAGEAQTALQAHLARSQHAHNNLLASVGPLQQSAQHAVNFQQLYNVKCQQFEKLDKESREYMEKLKDETFPSKPSKSTSINPWTPEP